MVRGDGFDGQDFRFNDIELVTDKREYAPGDKVKLLINTNRNDGTVLLFVRPTNGVYLPPRCCGCRARASRRRSRSCRRTCPISSSRRVTVAGGRVHTEMREVIVPPEKRVLNVEVAAVAEGVQARPEGDGEGQADRLLRQAVRRLDGAERLRQERGVHRRRLECAGDQASSSGNGGGTIIRRPRSSLDHSFGNLLRSSEIGMSNLGVFGATVVEEYAERAAAGEHGWTAIGVAGGRALRERPGGWIRRQQRRREPQAQRPPTAQRRRQEVDGQEGQLRGRRAAAAPAGRAGRSQELRRHRLLGGLADHRQGRSGRGRR